MPFAETVVKGPVGSLMNRWSSHRTVRECSEHRCKGFRRVSGINLVLEGALRRTPGAGSRRQVRRRTRIAAAAGPSAGAPPAALRSPDKSGSVRAATSRMRPPKVAHALRSEETPAPAGSHTAADGRREERSKRGPPPSTPQPVWGHDAAVVTGPGGQDPVVAKEMKMGREDQSRQLLQ